MGFRLYRLFFVYFLFQIIMQSKLYNRGKFQQAAKAVIRQEAETLCGNWLQWEGFWRTDRSIYADPKKCALVHWPLWYRSSALVLRSLMDAAQEIDYHSPAPVWCGWHPGMEGYLPHFTFDDLAYYDHVTLMLFVRRHDAVRFVPTLPYLVYTYARQKHHSEAETLDPICEKYFEMDCELFVLEELLSQLALSEPVYTFEPNMLSKVLSHCCDLWESRDIIPVYEWCVSSEVIDVAMQELEIPKKRITQSGLDAMKKMLEKEIRKIRARYIKPIPFDSLSSENQDLLPLVQDIQMSFL